MPVMPGKSPSPLLSNTLTGTSLTLLPGSAAIGRNKQTVQRRSDIDDIGIVRIDGHLLPIFGITVVRILR